MEAHTDIYFSILRNMWQRHNIQVKRDVSTTFVVYASCAFSNTYLVAIYQMINFRIFVAHVDHEGTILFKNYYPVYSDAKIKMLNDKQVVIFHRQCKVFQLLNLETYKIQNYSHHKIPVLYSSIQLSVFPESRLIAVTVIDGFDPDSGTVNISYFDADNKEEVQYYSFEINGRYRSCAVDRHSKIAVFNEIQMTQIQFFYFTLKDNPNKKLNKIIIKNPKEVLDVLEISKFTLERLWEIGSNTYWLAVSYSVNSETAFLQDYFQKDCIIDASKSQTEAEMRKQQFNCGERSEKISMQPYSDSTILRIIRKQGFKYQLSLVRNENKDAFCIFETLLQNGVFLSPLPASTLSSGKGNKLQANGSSQHNLTIISVAPDYTIRNISMLFLLHLNEDFDDDLLQDAIEMID